MQTETPVQERATSPRLTRPPVPRVVRAADLTLRLLEKLRLLRLRVDEQQICAMACRKTGLSDFGDEQFRSGLRAQLAAQDMFEQTPSISRLMARCVILKALCNRLLIEDQIKRHPEILQVRPRRPLVIVGLPRTGTTLLQNLLSQDPAARPLLLWEALSPVRPAQRANDGRDPRQRHAERVAWAVRRLAPGLSALHPFGPNEPQECGTLFRSTFILPAFGKNVRKTLLELTPERIEWAYRQYYRQLQLLEWQRPAPGHWLLKWPLHLVALDTLAKTLPDAAIVQTHRDPLEVVPSNCQLISHLAFFFSEERWNTFPQELAALIAMVLRRSLEARQQIPSHRIVDVEYRRLVSDPIGVLRAIYDHFDYRFTTEVERRAQAWLNQHPAPTRGRSYYDFRQFGLDRDGVREAFAFYDGRCPASGDA